MESNLFHSSIFQIFTANSYLVELLLKSHFEENVSSLGGRITFSPIIYIFIINLNLHLILNLNFVSIKLGLIKYKRNEDKKNMDSDFKFKFLFEIEFEFCSIYELKCAKF